MSVAAREAGRSSRPAPSRHTPERWPCWRELCGTLERRWPITECAERRPCWRAQRAMQMQACRTGVRSRIGRLHRRRMNRSRRMFHPRWRTRGSPRSRSLQTACASSLPPTHDHTQGDTGTQCSAETARERSNARWFLMAGCDRAGRREAAAKWKLRAPGLISAAILVRCRGHASHRGDEELRLGANRDGARRGLGGRERWRRVVWPSTLSAGQR